MSELKEYPSYYTVIPSYVRYNKKLSYFEIVLYSEIVALSNAYGYTFASNSYFAKCFDTSVRTISRSISKMKDLNLIRIEIDSKNSNQRKIFINLFENNNILYEEQEKSTQKTMDKIDYTSIDKIDYTPIDSNDSTPLDKNVYHNNIKENNIIKDNTINNNMSIKPKGLNNTQSKIDTLNPFFKKRTKNTKSNSRPDVRPEWLDEYLKEVES